MTQHKMTVEVDFEVDESDIITYASEILADRVEKNAWYHKIREGVDAMVMQEVRAKVAERIALALERGITRAPLEKDAAFPSAQSGEGGDWYKTIDIDDFIAGEIHRNVAIHVERIASRIAEEMSQKDDCA